MAGEHNLLAQIAAEKNDFEVEQKLFYIPSLGKHLICVDSGAPDDDEAALIYVRTDGSNGDEVIYTWDATATQFDALSA